MGECFIAQQLLSKDYKWIKHYEKYGNLYGLMIRKIRREDALTVLDDLLQAFAISDQTKRFKFVEKVLKFLCKAEIQSQRVDMIIKRIAVDFPQYSKVHMIKFVEFCESNIRSNNDNHRSWKDLLPLLLERLEDENYITYNNSEVSGLEYKSLIVESICKTQWMPDILISLAEMFVEMSLKPKDHDMVVRVLCNKLPEVEGQAVPPLVNQMLKLCRHRDGKLLFGTLREYFTTRFEQTSSSMDLDDIGEFTLKDILEIEGNVLYHIYQAAQLSHKSLKDFIHFLKTVTDSPKFILNPFIFAMLLNVANIYEDEVFEILKSAIARRIQDNERRKNSTWIRQSLSEDEDIMLIIERIIDYSKNHNPNIRKSLMDLSFILMDTKKSPKVNVTSLWDIGIKIMQKLVKKQHDAVATVLQMLTQKIIAGGTSVTRYTDCLSYLCREKTMIVLDSEIWVTGLLEQLLVIPGTAATQVLYSITPLMSTSTNIRNTLVLVLRKALYRKGSESRQMAVVGFLLLMKTLKTSSISTLSQSGGSSSNSTVPSSSTSLLTQVAVERHSQQPSSNLRCNRALCHEVLSILKRCFTHEVEVRLHLYKHLHEVINMNPELSEEIAQVLLDHFSKYYEGNDAEILPPIKFDKCSEFQGTDAILREPIAHLIFLLQKIYLLNASSNSPIFEKLAHILELLCKNMSKTELEHCNLDDRTELLDNGPKAQQKLNSFKLMANVYEALMSFRILSWCSTSVRTAKNIFELFEGYNRLSNFNKQMSKSKKGDAKGKKDKDTTTDTKKAGGKPTVIKLPNTIMDLDTMSKILTLLYHDSVPWASKGQADFLRNQQNFHRYILQTCLQLFQNAKSLKDTELVLHEKQYRKRYLEIGRLFYKHIVNPLKDLREFDEQTALVGVECFKEICELMCETFPSLLEKFLSITGEEIATNSGLSSQLSGLIMPLTARVKMCYDEITDEEDGASWGRIPIILLETVSILVHKIPFHETLAAKISKWLVDLAKSTTASHPVPNILLELILTIEERTSDSGDLLLEFSKMICDVLNTIDENTESIDDIYKIINSDTATQVYENLNDALKYKLKNIPWLLGRLKADLRLSIAIGMDDEEQDIMRKKERSLCEQMIHIMNILLVLSNAAIESSSCIIAILKNMYLLYQEWYNLIQYFMTKSNHHKAPFQDVRFVAVVKIAGYHLQENFNNLSSHVTKLRNNTTRKTDGVAHRNQVYKETQLIPKVIKILEKSYSNIVILSKKTNIPLDHCVKRGAIRDFKIDDVKLMKGLERLDMTMTTQNSTRAAVSQINNTNSDESDEELNVSPSKRLCTSKSTQ
ncbi:Fanconi anemia group I protein isoform X2 [Cephus cinctus]|uniref:Fanconi anemia group I protein isoform X2 n=1 Tax=Cephus cinctus TaxID=211228 RepID=A0AAJ7FUW1_CEPCN|nr:Fanconi anemia group I protein isoform X2 [Cephus cinctus]